MRTLEGTHINLEAFPAIASILDRIRKRDGCLGAQQDWYNENCPPHPVPFLYESRASQAKEDVSRAMEARDALKHASDALRQISEFISLQAANSETRVNALRLRRGFSSLPDEILSVILEYSAKRHDTFESEERAAFQTVKAATELSHTCRRFQQLMLRIPSLWNRIFSTMPPQMISACFGRLTIPIAEVVMFHPILPSPSHTAISHFIRIATNHARYWYRFIHGYEWYRSDGFSVDDLEEVAKATGNLDAPSLSELEIRHPPTFALTAMDEERYQRAAHYYSTWSMPMLSSLIAENVIPIPFANPVFLRSLSIHVDYRFMDMDQGNEGKTNLRALVTFLASCPVLEELILQLSFRSDIIQLILPVEGHVSLDHVTELAFNFDSCRTECIKSLFDVVHFPNASSMVLNIRSGYESDSPDQRIDNVLLSILPDASAFPNLLDLDLELDVELWGNNNNDVSPPSPISLPFSSLAKVRRLFLITRKAILAPIPDGSCLPALESLVLVDCAKLEPDWIGLFLGRLKAQGNSQPSQLKVERCKWKKSPPESILDEPLPDIAWDRWDSDDEGYEDVTADEMRQLVL